MYIRARNLEENAPSCGRSTLAFLVLLQLARRLFSALLSNERNNKGE